MNMTSPVSTAKERKTSGLQARSDAMPGTFYRAGKHNVNTGGTTGTFVYLKARRGMKSSSAQKAAEEWQPKMWTYLR